jgi:hypothetical protein
MFRMLVAAVGCVSFVASSEASLISTKADSREVSLRPLMEKSVAGTETIAPPPVADLTNESVVTLDGKACNYRDVPPSATIARIVVSADGATIIKIDFRSK